MEKVVEPVPGDIIGHNYLIECEIGRGGFGVVFRARHIDIERMVAIKVMLATSAQKDPSAKDRFRREATIAASLNYPNSLRVFDYGETEGGVFYLVMELLKGTELAKVLGRDGRLSAARALHIIRQVLYALSEAHTRGIVHRDIKPENIMLVELAYDSEFVKVMDFGIAKMVDAGEKITRAGITLGTPRYMPVEQLKGERLTPATDLYAVGLVLYEVLVGSPAFDAETAIDMALEVMRGPSVTVPSDAGVPASLVQVIEKAAARNVEDRYQTVGEFLDALDIAATALGLDDDDLGALPSSNARGIGASPARGGTVSMPTVADGDGSDVGKTVIVDSADLVGRAAGHGLTRSARSATTQALDVDLFKDVPPRRPLDDDDDDTQASTTLTGKALSTTEFRRGADGMPVPLDDDAFEGPTIDRPATLIVGLHAATILLLIVAIIMIAAN